MLEFPTMITWAPIPCVRQAYRNIANSWRLSSEFLTGSEISVDSGFAFLFCFISPFIQHGLLGMPHCAGCKGWTEGCKKVSH